MHRLVIALAAALAVGAVVPSQAQTAAAGTGANAGHGYSAGSAVAAGGPVHGIVLTNANKPFDATLADMQRLADDGVNTVTLYVTYYFPSPHSSTIRARALTPSDQEVTTAIDLAHSLGLAVELSPILWSSGNFVWRGALDPTDIATFWQNYRTLMLHFATMAQQHDVELFTIGTEYQKLERYTSRWRSLARQVRRVYSGKITYMTVTTGLKTVRFWRSLDYIGVSPYYGLSDEPVPTYDQLMAGWQKFRPRLRAAWRTYHKPLLFNEVGYLSAQGALAQPWVGKTSAPASEQVQANAYAALLDSVAHWRWVHGVVFYAWSPPVLPGDKSFSPRGKLAECVMAKRWASPSAPRLLDGTPVGCVGGQLSTTLGVA